MDDAKFFTSLASRTNTKGRNALSRVKRACDALEGAKTRITPSSVGRWCAGDGPCAGAIYNSKGLLKAYVLWRGARQKVKIKSDGAWLGISLSDPYAQATFDSIKAENTALLAENQRLKAAFRHLAPLDYAQLLGPRPDASTRVEPSKPQAERPCLLDALKKLSNLDHLAKLGIKLHKETGSLQMPGKIPEILLTFKEWEAIKAHCAELNEKT